MLKKLTDQFFSRGLAGGSRFWFVVGGLAGLVRLAGRVWGRQEQVVLRERLEPGEQLVITHEVHPRVTEKQARRAARAQRRAARVDDST